MFSDPCVFHHKEHKGVIIVYVDDILLIHKRKDVILNMHNALAERYELRNLGPVRHYLGMRIIRCRRTRRIWISQDTYIEEIVHKYGMSNSKHTNTPMVPDGANLQPFKSTASPNITSEYQSLIGSIGYAANMTRADIAYATHKLCQFTHNPSEEHLSHAKRVLAYLNIYPDLAICLGGVEEGVLGLQLHHKGVYGPPGLQLHGAADAAFADNADNRSSTFGYAFKAAGGLISYKSSRQGLVATSSTEAEYVAMTHAAKEAIWLKRLLQELQYDYTDLHPLRLEGDNKPAIALTRPERFNNTRTKHIEVYWHYIREEVTHGNIQLLYVSTNDMIADGLTKPLPLTKFRRFVNQLGLQELPKQSL